MEKGQSEVTNKIRTSIKEKLAEISDLFDDELPEYIMILVANQRSKSQIEKDLSLFLRQDTVNFTNWLWDLLHNLNVQSFCTKNSQPSVSKSEIYVNKISEPDDDTVELCFDTTGNETDFLIQEDTNDSLLSKTSVISLVSEPVTKKPVSKSSPNHKAIDKPPIDKSPSKILKSVPSPVIKEPLPSAVVPVKRKRTSHEDEYDPDKPEFKKKTLSCPSPRKFSRPAALQANKLLLKAVDDATKSVMSGKSVKDFYKPTPIKVLTENKPESLSPYKDVILQKKDIDVQECQEQIAQPNFSPEELDISEFEVSNYEYSANNSVEGSDVTYDVPSNSSRTIYLKPASPSLDTSSLETMEYADVNDYSYSLTPMEELQPEQTHFIVTLDGVSRTTFKRKFEEDSVDSVDDYVDSEKEEEPVAEEVVASPEKKMKLNERCKYWPACKNSDQCSYHHPTVACKCFPDCKFGDKCLYIHPNCKFDALCSRKDCPFTHASKRKLPFIAVPVKMVHVKPRKMNTVCKFFPKCFSKHCPFIHPKLCRYGTECRLPMCLFGHFPLPSRSQMKWHATVS